MIKEQLQAIREEALKAVTESADMKEIDALRVKFLGKKGELTAILKQMGGLSAEERPVIGQMANEIRADIENAVKDKTGSLKAALTDLRLKTETVDVTMPGKRKLIAKRHPMNIVLDDLKSIFHGMGYTVYHIKHWKSIADICLHTHKNTLDSICCSRIHFCNHCFTLSCSF